jgi:hypothetical protein
MAGAVACEVSAGELLVVAELAVSTPVTGVDVELFSDSLLQAAINPQMVAAIIPADINFKLLNSIILFFNERIVWLYISNAVPGKIL